MAARGEAQADVEVSTLVVPAWRLRWRAPELALVLGERAVALASARRDEVDRLRAEALVVFASNRMGRGVRIADRALDALKAAETAAERETAWRLRVELADSARSVGAPLTGFAAVRPVLEADDLPPGLRAAALVQAAECLVSVGRGTALTRALDEADHLYQADPLLDHDTTLLHRGLLRAAAAGQHRRWGDLRAAITACRDGLAMLDRLKEADSDNGQVRGRLTVELVCALLDLNKPGEASEAGTPLLERPVRAPSASTTGWLRLALATRVHLPAGRVDQARDLLRDAADTAERHQLDMLLAESLLALAHVHEVAGNLAEALADLRSAHAAERRRARAVYAVRARLAAEFSGVHRRPAGGLHDELAALLRTGTQAMPTPAIPTPADTNLAPEVKQQLRQWRPVQMHRNEGVRGKRSRRAAEDMTAEGISAARAHAADRWRLVQPFGETEGDPQPGGRRRAPEPESPPTQGRPEHARSGQAQPNPPPVFPPPVSPPPRSLTEDPSSHRIASDIPHPTPRPAGTSPSTTAPNSGNAADTGLPSTRQAPSTPPATLTGGADPGSGSLDTAPQSPPPQNPAAPVATPTADAGITDPTSASARQDPATPPDSRTLGVALPDDGIGIARQGSAGLSAGHAGVAEGTSAGAQRESATPADNRTLGVALPEEGMSASVQRDSATPADSGTFGVALPDEGASAGGQRESATPVDSRALGVALPDDGVGVGRQEAAGSGGHAGGSEVGGGVRQRSVPAGGGHAGEVGLGAESGGAQVVPDASSATGGEAGERSVPAAGLIAAAGAVRSGRRRAAREAAEEEGERSSGEDPSVLDVLKAAGLLDPQRAGGRRRAPDTEEEAVPQPEPESQVKPEPVQWRVEAPQRLRTGEPAVDMFDSPTMVQPAVRDDVPPVGLGAAFVKGPVIPTARVPDPPDYPWPTVPDFGSSPPDSSLPDSSPQDSSVSAAGSESATAAVAEPMTEPVAEAEPEREAVAESVDVVAETGVVESRPVFPPAENESMPEPTPEPDQIPGVPEPDQVPPVPIPDPVPSDPSPEASPEPPSASPAQFGPTGFLSAADVEHDDTPAPVEDPPKEPFITAVVVGGKTIDLPAIVVEPTPPAPDSPSATRASRRHKSDLSLAELLAEALVAYEDARREDEAAGRVDEDTVPITPVAPESDAETTAPIQRVDPPRFDTWTLPES